MGGDPKIIHTEEGMRDGCRSKARTSPSPWKTPITSYQRADAAPHSASSAHEAPESARAKVVGLKR